MGIGHFAIACVVFYAPTHRYSILIRFSPNQYEVAILWALHLLTPQQKILDRSQFGCILQHKNLLSSDFHSLKLAMLMAFDWDIVCILQHKAILLAFREGYTVCILQHKSIHKIFGFFFLFRLQKPKCFPKLKRYTLSLCLKQPYIYG